MKTTVIMVTNDIDEAILLADRVYPLTRGPAATLGQPIDITLPRPRSRKRFSLIPEYQQARRQIVSFLETTKQPQTPNLQSL
jgi:nitrate/nitrite transport system ATP-binding protein